MNVPVNPQAPRLPPDEAAWLPVAQLVIAGEFARADASTRESLRMGLRSIQHPLCRRALEILNCK